MLTIICSEQRERGCLFYYSRIFFFNSKNQTKTKTKQRLAPYHGQNQSSDIKDNFPKTVIWEGQVLFFLSFAGLFKSTYITRIKIRKVAYLQQGWESGK